MDWRNCSCRIDFSYRLYKLWMISNYFSMSLQINLNATGNVKGVIRRGFLTKIQFLNSFGRSKPIVRADRRINEGLLCSFDRSKRLELARASCHVKRGIDIGRGWVLAARVINHGLSLIPLPRNQYDDNRATSLAGIISRISNDPGRTVYHRIPRTMVKRSSSAGNVSRGPQYRPFGLAPTRFRNGDRYVYIYRVFFLTRPTIFFLVA